MVCLEHPRPESHESAWPEPEMRPKPVEPSPGWQEDAKKFLVVLTEKFARQREESRLGALERELSLLRERVDSLARTTAIPATIESLTPAAFELTRAIHAVVYPVG